MFPSGEMVVVNFPQDSPGNINVLLPSILQNTVGGGFPSTPQINDAS